MPDWKTLLQEAIGKHGQAEVARKLGLSPSTISLVNKDDYPASTTNIEVKVMEIFGGKTMEQIPEGYMQDSRGRLVPIDAITPSRLLADDLCKAMAREADEFALKMGELKLRWLENLQTYLQTLAEQYDINGLEGKNGDFSIFSYDGVYKIERTYRKIMVVDEAAAAIAKELVDRVVDKLSVDLSGDVRKAIRSAFRRDDKGKYSATGLKSLATRFKMEDDDWHKAQAAIADAVTNEYGEPYVRFYVRKSDGNYVQMQLDMSNCAVPKRAGGAVN